jgi:hypothetical protein
MPARAPEGVSRRALSALFALCALVGVPLCSLAAVAAMPGCTLAQSDGFKPPVQFEMRADLLGGPPAGAQLGAGANVTMGSYIRIGADAALGASSRDGGAVASGRVDFVSRYLLDPFREFRLGPYVGGGFTAQWDRRANWRGDLLVIIGVEGPVHAGWRTSVELGLGGGARLGVVLRRARSNGR